MLSIPRHAIAGQHPLYWQIVLPSGTCYALFRKAFPEFSGGSPWPALCMGCSLRKTKAMTVASEEPTPILLLTKRKSRSSERRIKHRLPFDERIIVLRRQSGRVSGEKTAWTLNLSDGGIRIMTPEALNVGEVVAIRLETERAPLAGRVVWVSTQLDGCVAGIAFGRN